MVGMRPALSFEPTATRPPEETMRFVFTLKTKAGNVVEDVHIDARDQREAEEKVKRQNPSCTVVKCEASK
jgi:hypothetical protein